jgi:hypothetical protein
VTDTKSSLGDTKSSLGDTKSSLGDTNSSLGDTKSSLGDAYQLATRGWYTFPLPAKPAQPSTIDDALRACGFVAEAAAAAPVSPKKGKKVTLSTPTPHAPPIIIMIRENTGIAVNDLLLHTDSSRVTIDSQPRSHALSHTTLLAFAFSHSGPGRAHRFQHLDAVSSSSSPLTDWCVLIRVCIDISL